MNLTDQSSHSIEFDVYRRSQRDIRTLKSGFPEELVNTLAREVIRRLADRGSSSTCTLPLPSQEQIEELCLTLISDDDGAAADMVSALREKNVPVETIYLKYLAAAARMLGDWWDEDRVDFVKVTIGTGRMVAIMRAMKHMFSPALGAGEKSAVFASLPGDTHTVGVRMAADLFRKEGWEIDLKVGLDHDALLAQLEGADAPIIGLSVGGRHSLDALSRLVIALQICCPHAMIIASGHIDDEIRPVVSMMGVDSIASDIDEAKEQMWALWERVPA